MENDFTSFYNRHPVLVSFATNNDFYEKSLLTEKEREVLQEISPAVSDSNPAWSTTYILLDELLQL